MKEKGNVERWRSRRRRRCGGRNGLDQRGQREGQQSIDGLQAWRIQCQTWKRGGCAQRAVHVMKILGATFAEAVVVMRDQMRLAAGTAHHLVAGGAQKRGGEGGGHAEDQPHHDAKTQLVQSAESGVMEMADHFCDFIARFEQVMNGRRESAFFP